MVFSGYDDAAADDGGYILWLQMYLMKAALSYLEEEI